MNQMSDDIHYCKKGVLVVHDSIRCIDYCKKGVLIVHESMSDVFITVKREC